MNHALLYTVQHLLVIVILLVTLVWLFSSRQTKVTFVIRGMIGILLSLLTVHAFDFIFRSHPSLVHHLAPISNYDYKLSPDYTLLTAFLAFLVSDYSRRFGALLLLLAIGVGATRVAAGIYSPLDIVSCFAVLGVGATLAIPIQKKWFGHRLAHREQKTGDPGN